MKLNARLLVVVLVLLAGLGSKSLLARRLDARDDAAQAALTKPLAQLPYRIGDWVGRDEPPAPEVLEMMKLDDYLQRAYRHPSGQHAVLWVGFSKTSRDQYHYPTVCMTGRGWTEDESERAVQPSGAAAGGSRVRFRFHREDRGRQYVYYWYYLLGESAVDRALRRLSERARIFLRGRSNASATVEIFSQSPSPNVEALDEFARNVARELHGFLPPDAAPQARLGANL